MPQPNANEPTRAPQSKASLKWPLRVCGVLIGWVLISVGAGRNSRHVRAASECHEHLFRPSTLVDRDDTSLCAEGTWECPPTAQVTRGTASYERTSSEQAYTHVVETYWRVADEGCRGDTPQALSRVESPPFYSNHSYFLPVHGHTDWNVLLEAALADVTSPGAVLHAIAMRMLGDTGESFGSECP
jgi:hypothetical protein